MKNILLASLIFFLSVTATAQNESLRSVKKNPSDCLIVIGLKGLANALVLDTENAAGIDFNSEINTLVELQYSNYFKVLNSMLSAKYIVSHENRKFIEIIRETYDASALTPQFCGYREEAPAQVWSCTRKQLHSIARELGYLQEDMCTSPYVGYSLVR